MTRVIRRKHWLAALPLTVALVLSACGGQQSSPSTQASGDPEPDTSASSAPTDGGEGTGEGTAATVRAAITA